MQLKEQQETINQEIEAKEKAFNDLREELQRLRDNKRLIQGGIKNMENSIKEKELEIRLQTNRRNLVVTQYDHIQSNLNTTTMNLQEYMHELERNRRRHEIYNDDAMNTSWAMSRVSS